MTRRPLPSTGSSVGTECPGFIGTIRRYDFLPSIPPHFVAFAWRYHPLHAHFVPSVRRATPKAGGFCCSHRLPLPVDSVETAGSLTFPGNPHCAYALLSDPGRIVAPTRPITMQRCSPRSNHDKGSHDYHFRGSITRPRHSLSTLRRVDHSTTTQDSLQAVGQTLPDGLLPAGFLQKVSEFNTSHPPFLSFRDARFVWL